MLLTGSPSSLLLFLEQKAEKKKRREFEKKDQVLDFIVKILLYHVHSERMGGGGRGRWEREKAGSFVLVTWVTDDSRMVRLFWRWNFFCTLWRNEYRRRLEKSVGWIFFSIHKNHFVFPVTQIEIFQKRFSIFFWKCKKKKWLMRKHF